MAFFILLDIPLGEGERNDVVRVLRSVRHHAWTEAMGFGAEYRLPDRFARYATKEVVPEAYDPVSAMAVEGMVEEGLLRLEGIEKALARADHGKRLKTVEGRLERIGDEKEGLLAQARSFVLKTLATNGILGSDPGEGREKDRQDRGELEGIYSRIKNSPAYLDLEREEEGIIEENRLLLDSSSFPQDEREALKDMEGTGIRVMHDRHCPKTVGQRRSELRSCRRRLKAYRKALDDFSSLLNSIMEKHALVGLTMDLKRPSKRTFLSPDQEVFSLFPFPGRTIVVVRQRKGLANKAVNCHNNQRT